METGQRRRLNGRYELVERIGAGGMAIVYLGRDTLLGRTVAVKVLRPESASDPTYVERFTREARAAAALTHPHVTRIYDVGTTPPAGPDSAPQPYMVMEYVPGVSLKDLLRQRGPLPEREALTIAAQIASALEAAHAAGLIHRDIKPHNVLLDPQGTVRVADFGIAHVAGLAELTATGAVSGTAQYISPEQAQRRPLDGRSDLYSLGVVLYEMLTGRLPFEGESLVEVALQHVHDDPIPPRQLRPDISITTEAIVLHALAKDPTERFRDAAEMRTAIERALAPATVTPTEPGVQTPGGSGDAAPEVEDTSVDPVTWVSTALDPPARTNGRERKRPRTVPSREGVTAAPAVHRTHRPWLLAVPLLLLLLGGGGVLMEVYGGGHHSATRPPATVRPHRAPVTVPTKAPTAAPPARTPATTATPVPASSGSSGAAAPTPVPTVPQSTPSTTGQVAAAGAATPRQAVDSFYSLVSQQNFSAAAQLWTPQMRAAYPPAQYIDDRFRGATITVLSARVITQSTDSATVAVDLQQTGGTQPGEIIGTWNLVKSPSGWLLAQPDLHYAAPPEAPTPAAVLKSGHAAVPPPHGRGHGKGPKGPHGHKP